MGVQEVVLGADNTKEGALASVQTHRGVLTGHGSLKSELFLEKETKKQERNGGREGGKEGERGRKGRKEVIKKEKKYHA